MRYKIEIFVIIKLIKTILNYAAIFFYINKYIKNNNIVE